MLLENVDHVTAYSDYVYDGAFHFQLHFSEKTIKAIKLMYGIRILKTVKRKVELSDDYLSLIDQFIPAGFHDTPVNYTLPFPVFNSIATIMLMDNKLLGFHGGITKAIDYACKNKKSSDAVIESFRNHHQQRIDNLNLNQQLF